MPTFPIRPTAALLALLSGFAASGCSREQAPRSEGEDVQVIPVAAAAAQRGRLRAVIHASGTVVPAEGA